MVLEVVVDVVLVVVLADVIEVVDVESVWGVVGEGVTPGIGGGTDKPGIPILEQI